MFLCIRYSALVFELSLPCKKMMSESPYVRSKIPSVWSVFFKFKAWRGDDVINSAHVSRKSERPADCRIKSFCVFKLTDCIKY